MKKPLNLIFLFLSLIFLGWQSHLLNIPEGFMKEGSYKSEAWAKPVPVAGNQDELHLLSRIIAAEAQGEPFEGQVAVGAVLLNRVNSPSFPNTLAGVVYEPLAFESVLNGHIWQVGDLDTAERAAAAALNGWDPTYGSLFFWNPSKPVNPWIWSRPVVRTIGGHVFGH